jgi:hypothetical protein
VAIDRFTPATREIVFLTQMFGEHPLTEAGVIPGYVVAL